MLFEFGIIGRGNFGHLLNEKRLLGQAVEVGTHRGEFAAAMLSCWIGQSLCCVDSWESGYDPDDPTSQSDRKADYLACRSRLAKFGSRVQIAKRRSTDATRIFANASLDFVYVDANHQLEHVREDLRLWWPKVKSGGLLAGHDFICPGEKHGGHGKSIQLAVMEFAERQGVSIYLVPETVPEPWSYYLEKP